MHFGRLCISFCDRPLCAHRHSHCARILRQERLLYDLTYFFDASVPKFYFICFSIRAFKPSSLHFATTSPVFPRIYRKQAEKVYRKIVYARTRSINHQMEKNANEIGRGHSYQQPNRPIASVIFTRTFPFKHLHKI